MKQPAHAHGQLSEWVISLTLSGEVQYQIGKDHFKGVKWDVMLIRPGAKQFWQVQAESSGEPGHWHVAYAVFDPPPHMLAMLDLPGSKEGYFITSLASTPQVLRRVAGALRKAQKLSIEGLLMRRELTFHAILEAILWIRSGVDHAGDVLDPRIARAMEFMNRHLQRPVTLEEIAVAAAASRSQLSLIFHRKLGLSPIAYLEKLRMERARQMLELTTHPIKHIARAVGYEDPKYFVKRFKIVVGVTPRGYRRGAGEG